MGQVNQEQEDAQKQHGRRGWRWRLENRLRDQEEQPEGIGRARLLLKSQISLQPVAGEPHARREAAEL